MKQYQLPDLPYDYGELEPVISGEIMEIHHGKHHKGYVANLNKALEVYAQAYDKGDLAQLIVAHKAVKFNAGGHLNHTFFWESLAPVGKGGGEGPTGDLLTAIASEFGGVDSLIEQMSAMTAAVQGSGWGWLALDQSKNRVVITTTSNQDLVEEKGAIPLLCIDVWEHAYYLQYQNVRVDFVKNIWKIVNWKKVEERFKQGLK